MIKALVFILLFLSSLSADSADVFVAVGQPTAAAPAEPDYGGEIVRGTVDNTSEAIVITLTSGITAGNRVVVFFYANNNGDIGLTSIADSRSNTYAVDKEGYFGELNCWIASAHVGTALQTSDTITVTIDTDLGNVSKAYWVGYLTNVASSSAVDQTGSQASYGTTVSAAASTTDANTTIIGVTGGQSTTYTYGSGNWTTVGAAIDTTLNARRFYILRTTETSSGSKDPGGAWDTATNRVTIWAAYK